jgi:hypothetical protein
MIDHLETRRPNDTASNQNSATRAVADGGSDRLLTIVPLERALAKNVLPAYLAPAVLVSIIARLIPDRVTGRGLAHAAFTTIAIPSALAALVVTVALRWHSKRSQAMSTSTLRIVGASAVICGLIALVVSGVLVANHHVSARLFGDAIPSALISSTIAAWQSTRSSSKTKQK